MLLPSRALTAFTSFPKQWTARCLSTSTSSSKTCDPLRVLFCGSDDFSIASLRALNTERVSKPLTGIESIDVVCRPGKATGRGLKQIRHPPIRAVAEELQLPLHVVDTFTGWTPPSDINLIIAVSFGLLVPPRILRAAKYGGLNVHPSMLPDLRGAAPIHHALLQKRPFTGVSLQTLHPSKFDHGVVLAQTAFPGVPIPKDAIVADVLDIVAPLGAQILVDGIRDRVFVAPHRPVALTSEQVREITADKGIADAPKLTPADRYIDWSNNTLSNADILLRNRILGRLWDDTTYTEATGSESRKRTIYHGWDVISSQSQGSKMLDSRRSLTLSMEASRPAAVIEIRRKDEDDVGDIRATAFQVEGGGRDVGAVDLAKAMLASKKTSVGKV